MAPLLSVQGLAVSYGATRAVDGVDLEVNAGEAVALVGANGAGKTTTALALSGVVRARRGSIEFDGSELRGRSPRQIVRLGMLHVPEGRGMLRDLTVRQNLLLGQVAAGREGRSLDEVLDLFPILRERRHQRGGTLSGGEQQMLSLARALIARPRLLILDEPSLGLAPQIIERAFRVVVDYVADGGSVLLIEQNTRLALRVTARAYVLASGTVIASGTSADLHSDPRVQNAYLGGDPAAADSSPASGVAGPPGPNHQPHPDEPIHGASR